MDENRLQLLLKKYVDNTITREDCHELLEYLDTTDTSFVSSAIDQALQTANEQPAFEPQRQKHVYDQLLAEIQERQLTPSPIRPTKKHFLFSFVKVAAVLVAAIAVGSWLYNGKQLDEADLQSNTMRDSILLPDRNQAILTLADGRTILLDDAASGILVQESGIEITKTEDGGVFYKTVDNSNQNNTLKYNTFSTPKGSTYRILLPDGTKVWLNTGSSIRYPVVFPHDKRTVSISGEAYFEVAHDASKPFFLDANGSTIQVLGTHFNVSAYADEKQTTTTLVEGSVNVSKNGNNITLKPGQQAVVDEATGAIHRSAADVRSAIAWKNGYFRFDNESIEDIVEKISRWYDIEAVEYEGQFDDRFSGTFQRSKNVAQLFSHLEKLAPIHFEIRERRVVVMK